MISRATDWLRKQSQPDQADESATKTKEAPRTDSATSCLTTGSSDARFLLAVMLNMVLLTSQLLKTNTL